MSRMHSALHDNEELTVKDYWKSFTITACLIIVEEAAKEVKSKTINACWKTLWPDCVDSFEGFSPEDQVDESVKKKVLLARRIGGEGFTDMEEEDVMTLVC